jgi:hypothetical protein
MAHGRLPFILAAVSLAPTALLAFEGGDVAVGVVATLMVAINLAALRIAERRPRPIQVLVNLGNTILAWLLAYDYWRDGKTGLPWAWAAAGTMFLAVTWAGWRAAGGASESRIRGR